MNLGGWLLLEPGPSWELFQAFGHSCRCEWQLLQRMRREVGLQRLREVMQAPRPLRHLRNTYRTCFTSILDDVLMIFNEFYGIVLRKHMRIPYESSKIGV